MYRIASIDSGASKTDILIYDEDGSIHINRLDISLNIHNQPIDVIQNNLDLVKDVLIQHGVEEVAWGLAGLDTERDYRIWDELLAGYKDFKHHILHDVEMALHAAEYTGKGILVVAGTGSNVYGFDGENKVKCGDWGAIYGDDFSGYRVGREFLNLILHIYDGRIDKRRLLDDFIEYLGIGYKEIPNWIYQSSISEVASLSKYICGKTEEEKIRKIFDEVLSEMELAIKTVINKLTIVTPIHYTGGLFRCTYVKEGFKRLCRMNNWTVGTYVEYPVIGGISYILRERGLNEDDVRRRLNTIYMEIRRRIT